MISVKENPVFIFNAHYPVKNLEAFFRAGFRELDVLHCTVSTSAKPPPQPPQTSPLLY